MGRMEEGRSGFGGSTEKWVKMATAQKTVIGQKALERTLRRLATTASDKAITAGVRASMVSIAKAMRAAVNSTSASSELKREARKSIGSRFAKPKMGNRRGIKEAKVGFSVGKSGKAIKRAGAARGKRIAAGKSGSKGVGVSAQNIHWFVLGTKKRFLKKGSARGPKAGHPTGVIRNVFGGVTRLAFAGSAAAAVNAARQKIKQVMLREARKKG